MQREIRERKKSQHLYTLDHEQKSGNYVMEGGQYGENLHNLLLDDKKVTERDKVCIINIEIRGIVYFNRNHEEKMK